MTSQLHGLRTAIYPVVDLVAATAWWRNLTGIDPYFEEPFYVGFNIGGYELGLLPNANIADGVQVYWGVDDVEGAVAAAVDLGASILSPAADVGDGIITATVRTPQGNVLGYIFNPHFSTDAP